MSDTKTTVAVIEALLVSAYAQSKNPPAKADGKPDAKAFVSATLMGIPAGQMVSLTKLSIADFLNVPLGEVFNMLSKHAEWGD